jgi:hypothetical protein
MQDNIELDDIAREQLLQEHARYIRKLAEINDYHQKQQAGIYEAAAKRVAWEAGRPAREDGL